jgi:hypothetical protein
MIFSKISSVNEGFGASDVFFESVAGVEGVALVGVD